MQDLSPRNLDYQTAKHHFAQNNFAGCADRWAKDADYRKCTQEHSHTDETMESWDQVENESQRNPQHGARSQGGRNSEISGTLFRPQPKDPTRYPRVNILNLDKLTALAARSSSSTTAAKGVFKSSERDQESCDLRGSLRETHTHTLHI